MKGINHEPGAPHKKEFLDHSENSQEEAIRERWMDLMSPGILEDSQENGEPVPFELVAGGGLTVDVHTGTANGAHDTDRPESVDASDRAKTGGDRIMVPVADLAAAYQRDPGSGPGTGTGTGPFKETANGVGGWVSTPESTKTNGVPVVDGVLNRIWIGYLSKVDGGQFGLHKVTAGLKRYPVREDGYDIVVNASGTPPSGDPKYFLAGTVDLTLSPGVVSPGDISQTGRTFARTRPNRLAVRLDTSLAPAAYSDAAPNTVAAEAHFNATGGGTVSPDNPHGVNAINVGAASAADLIEHKRDHHSNGLIVPDEAATGSALFPATSTSTPVGGDSGAVFMKQLVAESCLVDGSKYTEVLPKLTAPLAGFATGDVYVSFGGGDGAGVYGIILVVSGSDLTATKRIAPFTVDPVVEYLACTVEWSGTAFINPSPVGVQSDDRLFGSISASDLQADSVETVDLKNLAVTEPKLGPNAVTTAKIGPLAVTDAELAPDAVITAKILDSQVTEPKLGTGAVTDTKLGALAVTTAKLDTDAVTEPKVANDAIESRQIEDADNSSGQDTTAGAGVKTLHLTNEAVTVAKLAQLVQDALLPAGVIMPFGGVEGNIPSGWIQCDGRVLNGTLSANAALWTAIGTTWGGTGISAFATPDLRGVLLRGINTTTTGTSVDAFADPEEGVRTDRAGSPKSGIGSFQQDELESHTHTEIASTPSVVGFGGSAAFFGAGVTGATGGTETRPKNAYVLYVIKL